MNIYEAKNEIKNTIKVYLQKNKYGEYAISRVRQRPVMLIGAPGLGKTAIMEQIAQEIGVGLVAYSITHHTRQSAIGLPFISEKRYGEKDYKITEYTMSEIIASVYDTMEKTGLKEGILFIDEINCASETLAPTMLQFLQYKQFGQHRVPDGWVIVAAGNPPEYNKSVKEFDAVTLDRVLLMDVTPNYKVWKRYATEYKLHNAIISYLDLNENNFYKVESTVDGKEIVTARGWDDLSQVIRMREELNMPVKKQLIMQYLQHRDVATHFANYYDLYNKYKKDYNMDHILLGESAQSDMAKIRNALFDERLSFISILIEKLATYMFEFLKEEEITVNLYAHLKELRDLYTKEKFNWEEVIAYYNEAEAEVMNKIENKRFDKKSKEIHLDMLKLMDMYIENSRKACADGGEKAFEHVRAYFSERTENEAKEAEKINGYLDNAFAFVERAFGSGQEIVVFVTELTYNYHCIRFLTEHQNDTFIKYNKELLFEQKEKAILDDLTRLDDMLLEL
jgi:cytidylate kinase